MDLEELKQLVKQGESERLEFKKTSGQRTAAAKAVCAMLNGVGGFVIFGVTDKGAITGQEVSARTVEAITNEIRKTEPPAFPAIEPISLESGKAVVVIHVTGRRGIYAYSGRSYRASENDFGKARGRNASKTCESRSSSISTDNAVQNPFL